MELEQSKGEGELGLETHQFLDSAVQAMLKFWEFWDEARIIFLNRNKPAYCSHFQPFIGGLEVSFLLGSNLGTSRHKTGSPTRVCHIVDTYNPF